MSEADSIHWLESCPDSTMNPKLGLHDCFFFFRQEAPFIIKTYVNGAASSSTAVYFGQREPVRGQGCCCCCWLFSFRFFTLQTHLTLHHTGQRLMNRLSEWMNDWRAVFSEHTSRLTTDKTVLLYVHFAVSFIGCIAKFWKGAKITIVLLFV